MRRLATFGIPFVAIVAAGAGAAFILGGGPGPCGAYVDQGYDALDHEMQACVATAGQAHYQAVIRQTHPGGLLGEDVQKYLFPLMPPGDTDGREVRVLVLTEREPEHLVAYEQMALKGRLVRPTPQQVPYAAEVQLGKAGGYFFTDDLVLLLPDEIRSDGETWRRPE